MREKKFSWSNRNFFWFDQHFQLDQTPENVENAIGGKRFMLKQM